MRQGIFAGKVNRSRYAHSRSRTTPFPISRWDPVAAKLLALYPLPNLPGDRPTTISTIRKSASTATTYNVKRRPSLRVAEDYMFGRISQGWGENILPTPLPEPANQQGFMDLSTRRSMAVSETHTWHAE